MEQPLRQRSPRPGLQWLFQSLVGMVLWSGMFHAASASGPDAENFSGVLLLHEENLTVQVAGVSLRRVLAEFEKRSGAQVRWLTRETDEQISVAFIALPLAEALQRVLGEKSFLLFYRSTQEGWQLSQLWISAAEAKHCIFNSFTVYGK